MGLQLMDCSLDQDLNKFLLAPDVIFYKEYLNDLHTFSYSNKNLLSGSNFSGF